MKAVNCIRDALCLRYGWQPNLLPSTCVCSKTFSIEHALNCPCGGYPYLAQWVTWHHCNIAYWSMPQCWNRALSTTFIWWVSKVQDSKWCGWCSCRHCCRELLVSKESLTQCYRHLEQDKKCAYEARVREVELGCFTPLVFSTSGGLGPAAKTFYKRLASLIPEKHDQPYSLTLFWLWAFHCFSYQSNWAFRCYVLQSCVFVVKIIIPSSRMLPIWLLHYWSDLLSRQECLMLYVYLYALMFVHIMYSILLLL